jgi:hypothetical protein
MLCLFFIIAWQWSYSGTEQSHNQDQQFRWYLKQQEINHNQIQKRSQVCTENAVIILLIIIMHLLTNIPTMKVFPVLSMGLRKTYYILMVLLISLPKYYLICWVWQPQFGKIVIHCSSISNNKINSLQDCDCLKSLLLCSSILSTS